MRVTSVRGGSFILLVATLICSCSSPTAPGEMIRSGNAAADAQNAKPVRRRAVAVPSSPVAVVGVWGADDVALELQLDGGRVELSCAHGTINQPVFPAADGTFSVRGTLTRERGAPPPVTDQVSGDDARPATYQGKISGQTMTLTITVDGDDFSQTFTLVRDKQTPVPKCA